MEQPNADGVDGDQAIYLGHELLLGFEPERAHLFEVARGRR